MVPQCTGVWFSILRPRKFFHELAKNSLLTKILPPKKYLLLRYACTGKQYTDHLPQGQRVVAVPGSETPPEEGSVSVHHCPLLSNSPRHAAVGVLPPAR